MAEEIRFKRGSTLPIYQVTLYRPGSPTTPLVLTGAEVRLVARSKLTGATVIDKALEILDATAGLCQFSREVGDYLQGDRCRAKKDGKSSWNTSDYRDEDILKMVAAATATVNVGGKQVESANAAAAQAWLQRYAPTININQVIQVQKQSAMEVADATKRGLRDAALEGTL